MFASRVGSVTFAAVFFMICSAGMLLFNKMVMEHVHLPILVVSAQMVFALITVGGFISADTVCRSTRPSASVPTLEDSAGANGKHFRSANLANDLLRWTPVAVFFPVMLGTSMLALRFTTMTCVVVFRNISPLLSLVVESFLPNGIVIDMRTILSLFVILAGVVLYAWKDLHFSWIGVSWTVGNMFVAVLERSLSRYLLQDRPVDISKVGLVFLNNGMGLPVAFAMAAAMGEFGSAMRTPPTAAALTAAAPWMAGACCAGVLIAYSGMMLQKQVSATTMLVLNNINKVGVIVFEVHVMGKHLTPHAMAGCALALGGGLLYSGARTRLDSIATAEAAKLEYVERKGLLEAEES